MRLEQIESAYLEPPEKRPSGLVCCLCLDDIPQGGEYYDIDGRIICPHCVDEARRYDEGGN